MKIAVIGAGGFVGKEFVRQFSAEHTVLALRRSDLDITDREAVRRLILSERPALVINCAVLGVDACELDPSLAWAVNVSGAQFLAEAAAEAHAEFVHLSTNYVFDGKRLRDALYTTDDAPSALNVYGRTKLAGELAARRASRESFIVRTSWVFGAGKENFFGTAHRRLAEGKVLRAVKDIWASTTYVVDLVKRVAEILAHHRYGTYHVVNEGVCSYYEFALEAARNLGMRDAEAYRLIEAVNESEMQRVAPRPAYTPLRCLASERLGLAPMRDWREALAAYLQDARGPMIKG